MKLRSLSILGFYTLLVSTTFVCDVSSRAEGTPAVVDSMATKKKIRKAKKKVRKAKRKAKRAKKGNRKVASANEPNLTSMVVFSENTNFEKWVAESRVSDRDLASQGVAARVIGVRREIALNDIDAAKASLNVILNGGKNNGIEEGMTLRVMRKIPVIDPYHENRQSELEVEFGRLKILHTQADISVAKIEKIDSIQNGIFIGTRGVLIGDFVKE